MWTGIVLTPTFLRINSLRIRPPTFLILEKYEEQSAYATRRYATGNI
jgi:hypothetical protein